MGHWVSSNWSASDEYEASGTPWVTSSNGAEAVSGSIITIEFPRVTRFVTVYNNNASQAQMLKVGFSSNGTRGPLLTNSAAPLYNHVTASNANYFKVPGNTNSGRLELRCTKIFLTAVDSNKVDFSVVAGLTNIPKKNMFPMTGTVGVEGVG